MLRIITPMAKWWSAEQSVYSVRECMELMGGNGYIEDFVMPKLFRDVNVLPIWEGSGNIIVLDMLRASRKSRGMEVVFDIIRDAADQSGEYGELISDRLTEIYRVWQDLKESEERDRIEATAKPLFRELILLFQMALLIKEGESVGAARSELALRYFAREMNGSVQPRTPLPLETIEELIGWEY